MPLIPFAIADAISSTVANPLAWITGAGALGMAGAFGSGGQSFATGPVISPQVRKLDKAVKTRLKSNLNIAGRGDVRNKAFGKVSQLKEAEGLRKRTASSILSTAVNTASNNPELERGGLSLGGGLVRTAISESGRRLKGLFAPSSVLNTYKRQELINAVNDIAAQRGIDLNVASGTAGLKIAENQANQILSANRGSAIGDLISGIGRYSLMSTYLNQRKS
jgi:hypothetical protein